MDTKYKKRKIVTSKHKMSKVCRALVCVQNKVVNGIK